MVIFKRMRETIYIVNMATSSISCNEKNKVEERSYTSYSTRDHVYSHLYSLHAHTCIHNTLTNK